MGARPWIAMALLGLACAMPAHAGEKPDPFTQVEALLEYQMDRHFSASVSYSMFTTGEFIEETGDDEPIHLVAVEAMYRF